ncbi:hypothetical protein M885DRAFT_148299 [Pelagophyceae sp. CCMP2097]|nr:hypothetical protein M885DRAFT_148299 [Pelagophyceae sp. CCMP2097]
MARRVGLAALLILSLEALVPRPRAPQTRRLRSAAEPWYAEEGLKFDCTGCGDCCRVEGDVWLNGQEAAGMAKLLGVEEREYDVGYTDVALEGGWRRLIASEKRCIFLDDEERCSVHAARPLQCRAYPFWPRILQSREAWDVRTRRTASCCIFIVGGERALRRHRVCRVYRKAGGAGSYQPRS